MQAVTLSEEARQLAELGTDPRAEHEVGAPPRGQVNGVSLSGKNTCRCP